MHILASVAVLLPGQWGTESVINKNEGRFLPPTDSLVTQRLLLLWYLCRVEDVSGFLLRVGANKGAVIELPLPKHFVSCTNAAASRTRPSVDFEPFLWRQTLFRGMTPSASLLLVSWLHFLNTAMLLSVLNKTISSASSSNYLSNFFLSISYDTSQKPNIDHQNYSEESHSLVLVFAPCTRSLDEQQVDEIPFFLGDLSIYSAENTSVGSRWWEEEEEWGGGWGGGETCTKSFIHRPMFSFSWLLKIWRYALMITRA